MRMRIGALGVAVLAAAIGCSKPEASSMATDGPNQVVLKVPNMT